jgi:uncharacterized YceG family protein
MPDKGDWEMDPDGNLTPPPGGELKPDTDEFGRDDPDVLERERRRREREMRRKGGRPKKEKSGGITGGFRKLRKKEPEPEPEAPPPPRRQPRRAEQPPPPAEPAAPRAAERPTAAPSRRQALRDRVSRGGEPGAAAPPRPPRAGNYRRRRFAALVMALGGILLVWFLVAFFQPFAGDGGGGDPVSVDIPQGASAGDIADLLADAGVVDSARLFEWRLKLAGKSGDVQADSYSLAEGMSYAAAIDRLTGEVESGAITVTIPEGLDRNQIAADVLPEGVSSDEYLKITETAPKGFNPAQYGAKGDVTLEGFLFPATYDLGKNGGSQELVQQQLQAFEDNIKRVDLSYAKKKNLTAYDVLIIASMIDKEVQVASERDDVAAVIYNRLSQGIPLGIDATTRFETQNYTEQITNADLQKNTPYNTRLNAGLTPGPIGNPGLAAMKAAARPANVNYIYFVVKPGTCGEHSFTASEAEFEKLAAEYQQALQEQGGSPTEC